MNSMCGCLLVVFEEAPRVVSLSSAPQQPVPLASLLLPVGTFQT